LKSALAALHSKLDLAIKGAMRAKSALVEDANKKAMEYLQGTKHGQEFWKHFVEKKSFFLHT